MIEPHAGALACVSEVLGLQFQQHIIKAHTESDYSDCNRMARRSPTHARMA